LGWAKSAGGMFSSVEDFLKIMSDLMTGTNLLKRQTVREFFVPQYIFNSGDAGFGFS